MSKKKKKKAWKKRKEAKRRLRKMKKRKKWNSRKKSTYSNSKSIFKSIADELKAKQITVEEHVKVFRRILPDLLKNLNNIEDFRNPKKIDHKLSLVLLYGMLLFVCQLESRREGNKVLTVPQFAENLKTIFPELETLPHGDTVNRILSNIDVEKIQDALVSLVKSLLESKSFNKHKIINGLMIAIDGTVKFSRKNPWTEETLEKKVKTKNGKKTIYYVYILEATIVFDNGITIPLFSEILEYSKGDTSNNKQDCELRAFRRIVARIKQNFKITKITLLLDGLYPNGPVIELCQVYNWDFMIVLKDKSLPTVWEEVNGLKLIETNNTLDQVYGDREQHIWWINDILYNFGPNGKKETLVNVVICEETWQEVDENGEIVEVHSKHAWISSKRITAKNAHFRCNRIGRCRWAIESNILIEKHYGYSCTHCFSKNWNAMKGFHYLMKLAHLTNVIIHHTIIINEYIKKWGIGGVVDFFLQTMKSSDLDLDKLAKFVNKKHQIRWAK